MNSSATHLDIIKTCRKIEQLDPKGLDRAADYLKWMVHECELRRAEHRDYGKIIPFPGKKDLK